MKSVKSKIDNFLTFAVKKEHQGSIQGGKSNGIELEFSIGDPGEDTNGDGFFS